MSGQAIPLNQVPNEPTLSDLLNLLKREIMLELSCHHIGTVQSVNLTNQQLVATVNYTRTFFKLNENTGLYSATQLNYPTVIDCPFVVLGGGTANLTFPIAAGDECLLLFNDRDMDNWFQGGTNAACATPRAHSFSDAVALVGINSLANVVQSYDAARAVLRNGTTGVGVSSTKVKIFNQTTTLNTLLQSLITQIKAITTLNSDSTTGAVSVASQTQLANIATQIGGLLE